jgi:hypothetical protein
VNLAGKIVKSAGNRWKRAGKELKPAGNPLKLAGKINIKMRITYKMEKITSPVPGLAF